MLTADQVEAVIYQGLAALNVERPADAQVPLHPSTALFGVDAAIDSLSLVSLIVDVEGALAVDHGLDICLTDDRAMLRAETPYASVAALRDYVLELLSEGRSDPA